ncbi:MAG TPA: LysM peptidoglycan-binding domain-containing protein, partial [Baekduia sp.]|nr:LysM peptidoglycan-binding domain-containing protein [Baekduia sp.]
LHGRLQTNRVGRATLVGMSRSLRIASIALALALIPAVAQAHSTHVVQPGETLSGVAAAQGVSARTLAVANGLSETAFLIAGSTLIVPDASGPSSSTPAPLSGYRVRMNDTLSGVAAEHGVAIADLAAANGLSPQSMLVIGTTLKLPGAGALGSTTTSGGGRLVAPGDTLSGIAAAAGVTLASLAAANGLPVDHHVVAGTRIKIPAAGTSAVAETGPTASPATANTGPVASGGRLTAAQIGAIAGEYGVAPSLASAIAWQESGFNNAMVSVADARGIMQVLPGTWTYVENQLLGGSLDPSSASDNVRAGSLLLRQLLREAGGDEQLAIAGYYQGMSSVRRIGLLPETRTYVASVMALKNRFGG